MPVILQNNLASNIVGFDAAEANGIANFGTPDTPPSLVANRHVFTTAPDGSPCLRMSCSVGDGFVFGGNRTEIARSHQSNGTTGDSFNAPIWYVWDMYIPSSWPQTGNPYTCMQIHDTPDAGEVVVGWPCFELVITNGTMSALTSADFVNELSAASTNGRPLGGMSWPVLFDRWVTCALHANWVKTGPSGYMEFVYNGRVVAQEHNLQTDYSDVAGPYLKLGVYDVLHFFDFGTLTAYYKNLVIRDGADGPITALGSIPLPQKSGLLSLANIR